MYISLILKNKNSIPHGVGAFLIILSILCLISMIILIIYYLNRVKKTKYTRNQDFLVNNTKYKIYEFWINYAYLFIIFVLFLAFIFSIVFGVGSFL